VKINSDDKDLAGLRNRMAKMRDGPGKNALKQKALKILQHRKQLEAQRDTLQTQSYNMEQALMTTDNLRNVMGTVDAMKQANKEMRRQYGKINIDKIDRLQDEMADLIEQSNDLSEIMGRSYNVPEDVDEAELEAELEALGDEFEMEESLAKEGEGGIPSYLEDVTAPKGELGDSLPANPEAEAAK
jgi:charged multivesicular body protein 5